MEKWSISMEKWSISREKWSISREKWSISMEKWSISMEKWSIFHRRRMSSCWGMVEFLLKNDEFFKVDCFSFGVIVIETITNVDPEHIPRCELSHFWATFCRLFHGFLYFYAVFSLFEPYFCLLFLVFSTLMPYLWWFVALFRAKYDAGAGRNTHAHLGKTYGVLHKKDEFCSII